MYLRDPSTDLEIELLSRFKYASQHLYGCDWHPKLSVRLWESAFVKGFAVDLVVMVGQSGVWADWSLRHGKPMVCSYQEWLMRLKHPEKAQVIAKLSR